MRLSAKLRGNKRQRDRMYDAEEGRPVLLERLLWTDIDFEN